MGLTTARSDGFDPYLVDPSRVGGADHDLLVEQAATVRGHVYHAKREADSGAQVTLDMHFPRSAPLDGIGSARNPTSPKGAIVLVDQINLNLAEGLDPYHAVVESAVSRLRPVALAAATTVLGVMPLLPDIFWVALAVTIMCGLTIGTLLTMLVVPVMYATFYRVRVPKNAD